ncbi:type II toxin-antitoxin system VapC family toxin [Tunturibacter empetritectus]|uniref:Nucleic acid-binding protein n=1 Tax=Tunturiibacter empetritectus TaxID=3069691 RepID=A0A7W8IFT7_9BACT|nr:type II toxin-antitoxin system VapC family toxin [Edaphobacter lichenicola]MBB5316383.1 putative nucleic acid-binding protein [Edaphobacter lichenicola]
MSKVFLDTNIFIYLIEDRGVNGRRAAELLDRMTERRDSVYTSTLTLGEVLTLPLQKEDVKLADQYERILTSPGVHLLDFDRVAARIYARVRLDKGIKAPDAMQLSIAAAAQCDLFVTNDDRLSRKIVPGIHFVSGLERVPL